MDELSVPGSGTDPDLSPRPLSGGRHRGEVHSPAFRFLDLATAACRELGTLLLPVECVACDAEDETLCARCRQRIRQLTWRPYRAEASAAVLMGFDGAVLLPVMAAGVYRDELARSILAFKRLGHRQLCKELGEAMGRALAAGVPGGVPFVLVPVPSSPAAYRRRGFSPVHLLLSALNRRLGPLVTVQDALRVRSGGPVKGSGGQKGLGRGARAGRVRKSMGVKPLHRRTLSGRNIVLVDDVLTTGATLAEAARALTLAGGHVHGAVVLAAAQPPAERRAKVGNT